MGMTSRTGVRPAMFALAAMTAAMLAAVTLASCGLVTLPGDTEPQPPPPVTVGHDGRSFSLVPYTYCFRQACVDGMPPEDPPDVGSPPQVEVAFPLDGWSFDATFTPAGVQCGRVQSGAVTRSGDGSMVLDPAGPAGTYDVTLFGRGNGDLFVAFRWTTPVDGPMPVPRAELGILAENDGAVDSYGVEFSVVNMAATPDDASATVTVTAAGGQSLTFTPTPAVRECAPDGSLAWDGPDDSGLAAARLGPPPFTYRVVLTFDGTRHEAIAVWPHDVIPDVAPMVGLRFNPPLPAL